MQSLLAYGRLVARALLGSGLPRADRREFRLITVGCGFGKERGKGLGYGDDACFVASHRLADVLERLLWRHERLVWRCMKLQMLESGAINKLLEELGRSSICGGVADGVGGWWDYGVDPSQFSTTLMQTCERLVQEGLFLPSNPVGILMASYKEMLQNKVPLLVHLQKLDRVPGDMLTNIFRLLRK